MKVMKRLMALLRHTWWLWLLFFATSFALTSLVDGAFVILFPICLFTLVYFAWVRFDDEGNRLER